MLGLPVYMPEDTAIPAPKVPAKQSFTRPFVNDSELLQREQKPGVPGWLTTVAPLGVLVLALGFLAALAWGLSRLARRTAPRRLPGHGESPVCARLRSPPGRGRDRAAPVHHRRDRDDRARRQDRRMVEGAPRPAGVGTHDRRAHADPPTFAADSWPLSLLADIRTIADSTRVLPDVLERLADVRKIADSTRVLPDVLERLAVIERRVESLDREVTAMRQAVESIGVDVVDLRDAIHPIQRTAGRFGRITGASALLAGW